MSFEKSQSYGERLRQMEQNNLPTNMISFIKYQSCINRKELLEQGLGEGMIISHQSESDSFLCLFQYGAKIDFKVINNGKPFIIAKNNPESSGFNYPIVIFDTNENGNLDRLGFIDNKGNFISNILRFNVRRTNIAHPGINPIPIKIPTFTDKKVAETQPPPPIKKALDKNHKIEKNENLWKLIEENYDLSGSDNKERDIANIALRLGKLKQNKGVIKDGNIFLGKTLFLPNEIETIRLSPKETRKFTLKQEAAK